VLASNGARPTARGVPGRGAGHVRRFPGDLRSPAPLATGGRVTDRAASKRRLPGDDQYGDEVVVSIVPQPRGLNAITVATVVPGRGPDRDPQYCRGSFEQSAQHAFVRRGFWVPALVRPNLVNNWKVPRAHRRRLASHVLPRRLGWEADRR